MLLKRLIRRAAAIVIVCLFGTHVSYVAAGDVPNSTNGKSQLGGWVYIDRNNDGVINFAPHANPEWMIEDVTIELYSQNDLLMPLRTTQTDEHGRYFFANLDPGTYSLKEIQPIQYVDGKETLHARRVLASLVSPEKCKSINLGYMDPKSIDFPHHKPYGDEDTLWVPQAGEQLFMSHDMRASLAS